MKHAFVAQQRTWYPVSVLCRVIEVSVSGFYTYLHHRQRPRSDTQAQVRADLHQAHRDSRQTYGRPRLVRALRARGHRIGPKRVSRLMAEECLYGVRKGRFAPCTTDSRHTQAIAPNVLDRRFAVEDALPAWAGDITYIPTRDGWLYLAIVIALRTRQILGYCLTGHMREDLVDQALRNACAAAPMTPGTLFHSDRGSQYASDTFTKTLQDRGFIASMSRKGNCWDNAVCESFFATLKAEEATSPYTNAQAAHQGIASYIYGFYNPQRLHSALDYMSPNDFAKAQQTID